DDYSYFECLLLRQPCSNENGRFDVEVDAADDRSCRLGDLIDDSCRMAEPPAQLPGHELGGRELAGQPLAVVVAVIGDDPNALRTPRRGRGRGPTPFAFDAEALRASADGHADE